jgi:aminomethyltransferase
MLQQGALVKREDRCCSFNTIMKKTFLYETHLSLGAKMVPFGGYEMPIQYQGIIAEHFAARKAAVVFDTCHMGEFLINGVNAESDLDRIISCPVFSMKIGQCRYGLICNTNGGVIDDQILYRLDTEKFLMVVNASTQYNVYSWVKSNLSSGTSITNISQETGKIDLQGPLSVKILNQILDKPITDLNYYHWSYACYRDKKIIVSRTGYTGEIGFELYLDEQQTKNFWNACLTLGVKPAGLGARDTLRLEMGYPLYGHELDENRNAAESGFSRAIASYKTFIGSRAVLNESINKYLLSGIKLNGRRTARNGDEIRDLRGNEIGRVTSGSFSPSIECAIALGYIKKEYCSTTKTVIVVSGKNELLGTITDLPFYKMGTARLPYNDFADSSSGKGVPSD